MRCYYVSIGHLMLLDQLAVHIKDRRVLKISLAISGEQHSEAARCAEQNLDSIPMAGGGPFPPGYRAPPKRRRTRDATS